MILLIGYLFTLEFNIFLNAYFRFPTPLLFGIPLIFIFWQKGQRFLYFKEVMVLFILNLLFNVIAQSDIKSATVNMIVIVVSILFFNFFVGTNYRRFKYSIIVFYSLLIVSTIIMLCNHLYRVPVDSLRAKLIGAEITQSPSGICTAIFDFGYQLAALVAFLFIASIIYTKSWFLRAIVLLACLIAIYFGMQRSVLVTFAIASTVFLIAYYKYKSVLILGLLVVISVLFSTFFISSNSNEYDNIFAKNERNSEEDRAGLMTENLKIYSDYPLGLVFYGKNWHDVTKYNRMYTGGLTSHNAYLMFLTYLGPFVGLSLLLLVYFKVGKIFKLVLFDISNPKNAMLACLCFSFIGISLNSMFHNASFIGAEGAAVFIYFAILHRYNMQTAVEIVNVNEAELVQKPVRKSPRVLSYE